MIFELIRGGQRDMRGSNANRRTGQRAERLFGHDRDDLRAPAAQPRVLLDREQPAGLGHLGQDRPGIERHQRPDVDDRGLDAVLGGQLLGRR
jgi:hypothetical protein